MLWSLSFAAIANTFHVKVLRRPVESALDSAVTVMHEPPALTRRRGRGDRLLQRDQRQCLRRQR